MSAIVGTASATVTAVGDVLPADNPFTELVNEGLPSVGNFIDPSQLPNAQTNFENSQSFMSNGIEAGIVVGQKSFGRLDIDGNSQLRYQTLVIGDMGMVGGVERVGTGFVLITGIDALYNNDPDIIPAGLPAGFGSVNPRDLDDGFDLYLGRFGQGTLEIRGGGRAEIQDAVIIGDEPGSTGSLVVDGFASMFGSGGFDSSGGAMDEPHQLTIGRNGDGFMTISNGGTVVSDATQQGAGSFDPFAATIGSDPASTETEPPEAGGRGVVTVTGPTSKWIVGGTLQIGGFQDRARGSTNDDINGAGLEYNSTVGRGTLQVLDGGLVSIRPAIGQEPMNQDRLRLLIGRFGRVLLDGGDIRVGSPGTTMEPLQDAVQLLNDGVIEGSGRIFTGVFRNRYLGEIRIRDGQKLLIDSASEFRAGAQDEEPMVNFGTINVLGTRDLRAELEIDRAPDDPDMQDPIRPFFNLRVDRDDIPDALPTAFYGGLISAQHSVLRFRSAIVNQGMMAFTAGENYVTGDVINSDPDPAEPEDEGVLYFSGPDTRVVFENDLLSTGTIIVEEGADIDVLARNSFVTAGELRYELDPSNSSQISTAGDVGIAGKLTVTLSGFETGSLSIGDSFKLITAGGQIGGVDLSDPLNPRPDLTIPGMFTNLMMPDLTDFGLPVGTVLEPVYTPNDVFLVVTTDSGGNGGVNLAGDYNGDGKVDAADYVLWRNGGPLQNDATPGVQPGDYDVWRANFGAMSLPGNALAVPEPASATLILCIGLVALLHRHRC